MKFWKKKTKTNKQTNEKYMYVIHKKQTYSKQAMG
jgi:hypothetical protein